VGLRADDERFRGGDVAPALKETRLVLAQSVQIQDCQPLLR
jgi:hypothetical protein